MLTTEKPMVIQPVHDEDCECPLCRIYRYPNKETLEAFAEGEWMRKTGNGKSYANSDELWNELGLL